MGKRALLGLACLSNQIRRKREFQIGVNKRPKTRKVSELRPKLPKIVRRRPTRSRAKTGRDKLLAKLILRTQSCHSLKKVLKFLGLFAGK